MNHTQNIYAPESVRVSVLTPVYKHDIMYTRRCLESLKAQTLRECEFIIIDNGAIKEVKKLVDDVTRDDERFKIIKLSKNRGYGRAMNAGLAAARGEYIGVVESDDFIEPTMYEFLYGIGKKHDVDIVKSLFYIYEGEKDIRVGIAFRPGDYNLPKNKLEIPDFCYNVGSYWSAIYKREMIEKFELRFDEQPRPSAEDIMWILKTYFACRNIFITPKPLYHYRRDNPGSSIREKDSKVRNCMSLYSKLVSYMEHRKNDMKDIYWNIMSRRHFLNFIWAVRADDVSRWNWSLLWKVSKQFKYNMKKGYVNLPANEERVYRQVAYHPFRTFISGSIYPHQKTQKNEAEDTRSCVTKLLFVPIYSKFQQQNYTKERYLFGIYRKIVKDKIRKYYILGARIARVTPEEVSTFGFKGLRSPSSYVFSFWGIPLISRRYATAVPNNADSKYEYLLRSIHSIGTEIKSNTDNKYERLLQSIRSIETEIKNNSGSSTKNVIQNIVEVKSEINNHLSKLEEMHYQTMWFPGKVASLHRKVFPQFKNIHEGEDIVIVGCGPTLHYYDPISNAKHIFLNRSLRYEKIKFDYGFIWDTRGLMRSDDNALDDFCNYDCIKFCGNFLCEHAAGPSNISCKKGTLYRFYSSARWETGLPTLDTVIHEDLSTCPLADFMSISFGALHFALWTHPKRIFLVGLDTIVNGAFDGRQNPYHFKEMLQGYTLFQKFISLHYPETEIISVNPIGLRGMFRDIYTESYLEQDNDVRNPEILSL